jgi:multidrug efflux system membrane fusion protein
MKVLKPIMTSLVVAAIAAGAYYAMKAAPPETAGAGQRGRQGNGGPVAIVAEQTRQTDVPVYLEGVGSAKARNSVVVRPQVDGRLISVKFKEGQDVKKGDLLAKIDPVTYQAQLDQALAKKALDEALLANTKRDLARYEKVGTLAISQQQIDTQRALSAQQEAQIKSDVASIENLTAILGYTDIMAPIDGRVGIRNVDEGNLVRAGDTTGIVTITEVHPISVVFTLPQQQLPVLSKASSNAALKVEAFTTDSRNLLDTGTLQVVDNQVDPQTGTIRAKADFPNDNLQLWPGQFVNVRVLVDTLKNVVVAPTAAVQRGPSGTYVFVVKDGETVAIRPVKVTRQTEKDAVIGEGLNPGEMIVTSGFGRLEDGAKVKISGNGPQQPASPAGAELPQESLPQSSVAAPANAAEAQNATEVTTENAVPKATDDPALGPANAKSKRHHREGSTTSGGAP